MARTYRANVVGNEKSNKAFKKQANKKMRVKNNVLMNSGLFDEMINDLREVSNMYVSNKEWRHYRA